MSTPTPEQAVVLDADDRVRIVRAAPGCGKTWLVAEAIRRALANWDGCGGIAALSFTNVGGDEIRRAVGSDLEHPHFVGTLDSYVYRYIVRQFSHILEDKLRRAKLVAADQANALKYDQRTNVILPDHDKRRPVSLFDLSFTGGIKEQAVLALRQWGQAVTLSAADCTIARAAKLRMWRNHGWLSHSDVTYIAAAILRDPTHGGRIQRLVAGRFPFLVVDELQDTGWYLSEVIRDLLGVHSSKGLLVGDPDQAIYQFNGARPELFDTFTQIPGSREFPVRKSLRCPAAITTLANHLRSGSLLIDPRSGDPGSVTLIITNEPTKTINEIRVTLTANRPLKSHYIVARGNDAVEEIDGGKLATAPEFSSKPLAHAHEGVRHLLAGRSRRAIESAASSISHVLFDQPSIADAILQQSGIDHHKLRVAAATLLEAGRTSDANESSWSWGERMKAVILQLIAANSWVRPDGEKLSVKAPPKSLQHETVFPTFAKPPVAISDSRQIPVRTVHGVKGETHDTTIFYVTPAVGKRKCVSESWWSSNPELSEERRIAFVAATRSRKDFVMCVTQSTAENLQKLRPEFFRCFQVMTPDQYIATLQ